MCPSALRHTSNSLYLFWSLGFNFPSTGYLHDIRKSIMSNPQYLYDITGRISTMKVQPWDLYFHFGSKYCIVGTISKRLEMPWKGPGCQYTFMLASNISFT